MKKLTHIDGIAWINTYILRLESNTHRNPCNFFVLTLGIRLGCVIYASVCGMWVSVYLFEYVLTYLCDCVCVQCKRRCSRTKEKMGESQEAKDIIFRGYHFQRQRSMCIVPMAEQDVRLRIYLVCVFGFLCTTGSCLLSHPHWNHTLQLTCQLAHGKTQATTFARGLLLSPKN